MKKSLFFAAAAALALTACTSEDDILQTGQQKQVTPQEVGFDVYTPAATSVTRAGLEGTMTTNRLQRSEALGGGFGVYAYLVEDDGTDVNDNGLTGDANAKKYDPTNPGKPNFMVNQKLLWNTVNQGWYYNPLKYWPNETDNDSQTTPAEMENIIVTPATDKIHHLDRLSFFAYAPYVSTPSAPGITAITAKTEESEPKVTYEAAMSNPNQAVDLLWGVAPAGGLTYTAVNGRTVTVAEGMPLIDMTKPDVNTTMKFLFNHALARIGIKAVAAVDQVGAGGTLDPNTKITIKEITLTGLFGKTGILNLDNTIPNQANWIQLNGVDLGNPTIAELQTAATTDNKGKITLSGDYIAEHLRWFDDGSGGPDPQNNRSGVTTVKQDVIAPSAPNTTTQLWASSKAYGENELAYSETTPYYENAACTTQAGVTMPASYTINSDGQYTEYAGSGAKAFKYPSELKYYEKTIAFTEVQTTDVTNHTYDNYTAYSIYRKKAGVPEEGTIVYKSDAIGYQAVTSGEVAAGTYNAFQAYEAVTGGAKIPKAGKPQTGDFVVKDGIYFYQLTDNNKADFADTQLYTYASPKYTPVALGTTPTTSHYVACGQVKKVVPYYAAGTYYKRDANYFMVVPTKNFENSTNITSEADLKALRTVRVKIEYYITTEDSKLAAGRAQTKNVIEKDVVFPSLTNGKSYNLNLILGLTSVKMEAEVDDWKVINVQADLPQNTAE